MRALPRRWLASRCAGRPAGSATTQGWGFRGAGQRQGGLGALPHALGRRSRPQPRELLAAGRAWCKRSATRQSDRENTFDKNKATTTGRTAL